MHLSFQCYSVLPLLSVFVKKKKNLVILWLLVLIAPAITATGRCILATNFSCFHSAAGKAEESWCLTECSCYSDYSVLQVID